MDPKLVDDVACTMHGDQSRLGPEFGVGVDYGGRNLDPRKASLHQHKLQESVSARQRRHLANALKFDNAHFR